MFPLRWLTLLLLVVPTLLAAPGYQVEVKFEQKRFDVKRAASQSTEISEESWGYVVTVSNYSFKEIPNLRVDYVVFSKHQRFGSAVAEPKADFEESAPEGRLVLQQRREGQGEG
ncbi:MAG: hypothetical protein ABIO87_08465 [Chthoniobacterales bacterium]